jgi:hypothetical protein
MLGLLVWAALCPTMMAPLDLAALSDHADRILLGTVEKIESRWTTAHDAIYTEVTLRARRVYKGALRENDVVVVRREGGSVDGIAMKVFGAPHFSVGEDAVVFVETRGSSSWVVGMSQGKLPVRVEAGRQVVAPPDLSSVGFINGAPAPNWRKVALDDFERKLAGVLNSSRPR